jgi:hypothetical protein
VEIDSGTLAGIQKRGTPCLKYFGIPDLGNATAGTLRMVSQDRRFGRLIQNTYPCGIPGNSGICACGVKCRILIHWLFFFLFWGISYIYNFPSDQQPMEIDSLNIGYNS